MSAKKIKVNRSNKEGQTDLIKINPEELEILYREKIKPYPFEELVLIVLGGEFGVIVKFMQENISFSKLIVIEPNKVFYGKKEVRDFYNKIEKETNNKIEYIPIDQVEKNSQILLSKLVNANFDTKGLEVISNPFYTQKFEKQIKAEEKRLNDYLESIQPKLKKTEPEIIDNIQKKYHANLEKTTKIFGFNSKKQMLDSFNKDVDVGKGNLVVLIGFEHGYFAKHLLKEKVIHNLINIEVIKEFEEDKISNNIALESAFQSNNSIKTFYFTKGEEAFLDFFEFAKTKLTFIQNSKIIINPLYEKKHIEEVKKYLKVVTKHMKSIAFLKGNSISDEFYGMTNALYNLRKIDEMQVFKPNIQFNTVISVAGGPSLDNHMDYLKKIQSQYPVIAVEVIANKLIKNGIIPDIVCAQERTFPISKIAEKFDATIKSQSIYVTPNFVHTYNFNDIKHFVVAAQTEKSPVEKYIHKKYYSFSHKLGQSIYVGEVNLNVAMWFKPKQVLLFGHDLAITPKKIYATESEGAASYSMRDSTKEIGNRGQDVYITPIFHKFRNNTETILPKMIKKYGVKFISFSDGAKINYVEDAKEEDYPAIFEKKANKPTFLKLIQKASPNKKKIKEAINSEIQILEEQLHFFEHCTNYSKFTIMSIFIPLVVKKDSILSKVGRLMLEDFLSKHSYDQRNMKNWVIENRNDFISLIKRVIRVLKITYETIDNPESFPKKDSDFKTLFDYNLFAPIRDQVYDIKEGIKIKLEDKLKQELTKEDLIYATLAFLYSFEPVNFLKMGEVVSALGKYVNEDEQVNIIYQEGLERLIAFYEKQWQYFKEVKETYFYRYQLASMHYAAGHFKWVIDFYSEFTDLEKPEKIILADAYSDFGNFQKAFGLYKELLNESQNLRILINAFHCLIASEKVAEAKLFHFLLKNFAGENEQYHKNLDILNKQIEEILNWTTENGLKNNEELIKEKGETNQAYVIDFHLKSFEEIKDDDINLLMELFARENEIKIYRLKDRIFQLLLKKEAEMPDFSFYINPPKIEKL